jgi:hypothetical protein
VRLTNVLVRETWWPLPLLLVRLLPLPLEEIVLPACCWEMRP